MTLRKVATPEQVAEFVQKAQDWVSARPIFSDVKFVAVSAISEYIANEKGCTLYDLKQHRED